MLQVFNDIVGIRSVSVIHYLVEEALAEGPTGNDLKYLNAILDELDLDNIWILALLGAGRVEEAEKLSAEVDGFRARKAARKV